jgi:hypothetical protein
MGFWSYYFWMFYSPGRTFSELLKEEKRLHYGLYAALIPALGYTVFYIMASRAGGAPSTFKPWLAIPIEEYFHWDIYLSIPGVLLSIITTAGVIQLLSRLAGSTGTFEDSFCVIGFGAGVATWSTMLHDLTDAFLAFIGIIDMKSYEKLLNQPTFWHYLLYFLFLVYFTWFFILFTKGIREVHKTSRVFSILLGFLALIFYQGILLIFIR